VTSIRLVHLAAILIPLMSGCGSSSTWGGLPALTGDHAKLQGEWTVVSYEAWGQGTSDDMESVTFSGNEMIWISNRDGKLVDQFQLDSSSSPKRIDLFPRADDGSFQINDKSVTRGIYELNGDELTICHRIQSQPAPLEMNEPGSLTVTLKRNGKRPSTREGEKRTP
jgi:uncharacterized protein (TIGR03067 family)